jgi:DNA-binding MarR family transcriptional regulator
MEASPSNVPVPPTRLTALARRLVRVVTDRTRAELARAGFSDVRPGHNLVLAQVAAVASGVRITDMAGRAGVTKQAITLMVDHLAAGGYVDRVADPSDRRAKLVVLTERGTAAADASRRAVEEIERRWAQRLGAERLAETKATLADLIAGLEPGADGPGSAGATPGGGGGSG